MEAQNRPVTFGEKAVGISFNPGGNPEVDACKQMYAKLIDQVHALETNTPMRKMFAEIAIQQAVLAQMAAVKAITWKD